MPRSRPSFVLRATLITIVFLSATALAGTGAWSAVVRIGEQAVNRALGSGRVAPRYAPGGGMQGPGAPTVTATMTAAIRTDVDADGKADPGDTIRYTATIAVSGNDATGVHFSDTPDSHTTLVNGSIAVSPIAVNESYNSVGNMTLTSASIGADCGANPLHGVTCNDTLNGGTLTGFGATQGTANGTAPGGTVTTSNNGSVVLSADGTFVFNPAAGFEGADSFWYTLSNASVTPALTDTAQVTINVGGANGMVWFITPGGAGTGRQANPIALNNFRPINNGGGANPAAGDTIFLFEGAHSLTATLTLLGTQKLIGQDTTATLANLGAPAPQSGNAYPAVNNPTGTAVSVTSSAIALTLGSGNTLAGFTVGNSTAAITGMAVGTLSVRDVIVNTNGSGVSITTSGTVSSTGTFTGFTSVTSTGGANGVSLTGVDGTLALGSGDLNGNTGAAFNVSGGNATITYSGTIRNSGGRQVSVVNKTGGTVTFSGAVSGTGTGVFLDNNDQGGVATIAFSGGVTLSTGANSAFTATNGGIVTVTGGNNTITTTTGTPLNVANTNIGVSGLTFRSIAANGASNGIILNTTGTTAGGHGGLTVTGTGNTAGSGGTIQNIANRGASFITARDISLANMNFTNANTSDNANPEPAVSTGANANVNAVIHLNGVTNVTLNRLSLSGAVQQGINGLNTTGFTLSNSTLANLGNQADEDGIHFFNLLGTASITNTTISSSGDDNVNIQNNSGTANLTITGGSFNTGVLGSGLLFGPRGTTNTTVTISGVTTNNNFSGGIVADASDTATMKIDVSGSTVTNNNDGIQASCASGTCKVDIHDNVSFTGNDFVVINLLKAAFSVGGTFNARIHNNPIPVADGRPADAVVVNQLGGGALLAAITNNTITYRGTQRPILLQSGQDGNGSLDATITGNSINIQLDGVGDAVGILAQASVTSPGGNGASACFNIGGAGSLRNTFTHSLGGVIAGGDIRVRQRFEPTFVRLPGYAGGAMDNTAAAAYLNARNTVVSATTTTVDTVGGGGAGDIVGPGFSGGAACGQPNLAFNALGREREYLARADVPSSRAAAPSFAATVSSVVAPCQAGAALRDLVLGQRGQAVCASSMTRRVTAGSSAFSPVLNVTVPGTAISAYNRVRGFVSPLITLLRHAATNGLSTSLEASGPAVEQDLGTIPAGKTVTVVFDVTVDSPPVAQYSNQAAVSGSNFSPAVTSNTSTTTGDRFDTATALISSQNPADQGVSVTFTTTVTPTPATPGFTPDGTVQFKDGAANLGGPVTCADAGGNTCSAQLATAALTAATHSITAVYSGDASHEPSTSNAVSQVIAACVPNPVVTSTADTGANTLRDALANVCTAPSNTVTFTLGAGPHTIRLASALTVARNVSIVNTVSGTNGAVTVSGGGVTRVLTISSGKTAAISGLTIANGLATGVFPANAGGGILNDHGALTITNSTLSGNTAGLGGGVYNNGDTTAASLAIVNSTLSANSATADGGAIDNKGSGGGTATLTVTNTTISGNTANRHGGGIYNEGDTLISAPLMVVNATITNNRADNDTNAAGTGGGLINVTATAALRNTIVARNMVGAAGASADDIVGTLDTATSFNNLIGDGTNMTGVTQGSNGNQVGTAGSAIDPLLGALANNGGPTFTHALLSGSPAIDRGAAATDPVTSLPISIDQRGQLRPVENQNVANAAGGNGSDIGAYEAPAPPQAPDLQAASDTGLSTTDNITSTTAPGFDIAGVVNGATVDLLRDGTQVATGVTVGTTIALTDPTGAVGTHVYTARQTVAGGTSPLSTGLSVTIDTTPPPVPSIDLNAASDSGISSTDNLTNAATRVFTIANPESGVLVELLRAATSVSSTAGNGGTVQLSDAAALADNAYSYTARQTDAAGNVSTSPVLSVTIDSTSPTVAMTSAASSTTSISPIPVTVTFSEPVFDFTSSAITASNATVGNFTGSGATYNVDLTPSGQGTVTADIAAGAATDAAGNGNTAALQFSRTFDSVAPVATITPVSPDPRNTSVNTIQIVFSGAVTGFGLNDLSLRRGVGANLLTGAQTLTSGDNVTWTLGNLGALTGTAGAYTLTLTAAGAGISDGAGNPMSADATETWTVDTVGPTVTINQAVGQADPTNASPTVDFTAVFSEAIATGTFAGSDLAFSGTANPTTAVIAESGPLNGTTYTVRVSGMTSPGTVIASIPANAVTDLAGNLSAASTSTDNTVTILPCPANPVVTNTADSGPGSLRAVLVQACATDTITFNIAGPGPHTVGLTSGELTLDKNVTIAGPIDKSVRISGSHASRVFTVNSGKTVTLSNVTILDGSAVGDGGAIANLGTLTIAASTLSGNATAASGGAIRSDGTLTLRNSTLSGNTAAMRGGALITSAGISATLLQVTLAANSATGAGGGIDNGGTLHVKNSLIAANSSGGSESNLFAEAGSTTDDQGNNLLSGNPQIGPLQNNGGPTFTHALLPGSPALDAGDNAAAVAAALTTDQRGTGFARVRDGADPDTTQTVDIGAFEADPSVEAIPDKSTLENAPLSFTFHVGDAATAFDAITATSSNTALVPNANVLVGPDTPSTRALTLTPVANLSGMTTITVTASKTLGGSPLSMTDTFVLTVQPSADLTGTVVGPGSANAGTNVQYIVTVVNNGPSDATGVSVASTTPAGMTFVSNSGACTTAYPCSLGTMTAGASAQIVTTFAIPANYSGPTLSGDIAILSATTSDPNTANNQISQATTVTTSADLAITNVASSNTPRAGTNLTYTLTLTNLGPSSAAAVVLSDAVPANTTFVAFAAPAGWTATTPPVGGTGTVSASSSALASGASASFTMTVRIGGSTLVGTTLTDTASASSATTDPTTGNNTASVVAVTMPRTTVVVDTDGDGKADLAVFRPSSGDWYIRSSTTAFATNTVRQWGLPGDVPVPGDYDGDGVGDLAVYRPAVGQWFVLQSSTQYATTATYTLGSSTDIPVPGDYDGDGKTDPAIYQPLTGVWSMLTSGSDFTTTGTVALGLSPDIPVPADYDGDGITDVAVYRPATGVWTIRTSSSGRAISLTFQWGLDGDVPVPGDYDADGISDLAVWRPDTGVWYVRQSTTNFTTFVSFQWGLPGDTAVPGDYDGDGTTDFAVYRPSSGTWYLSLSTTNYTTSVSFQWGLSIDIPTPNSPIQYAMAVAASTGTVSAVANLVRVSDLDGEGRSDLLVFRRSTGTWFALLSSTNYAGSAIVALGESTDLPVTGDFDGDGKTDVAVFTPATGIWSILRSTLGPIQIQWGLKDDLPVQGDYDGDGTSDLAVYRPPTGEWFIRRSSTNFTSATAIQFGLAGDVPVPGDYDGDGLTDVAVYRPSTGVWYLLTSRSHFTAFVTYQLGFDDAITVPGDYDGDGRTDLAVWRPSTHTWYIRRSSTDFAVLATYEWGISGDIPVPGEYDGDGKTDLAVWRPSSHVWEMLKSSTNFTVSITFSWGEDGDTPILKRP